MTFTLSARRMARQTAGVDVLTDVDLELMPGEIQARQAENGADKFTFARIVASANARNFPA